MEFLVTSKLSPFLRLDHTQWQLQKQTSMYYKEVKLDFDARFLHAIMYLLQEVSYASTSKLLNSEQNSSTKGQTKFFPNRRLFQKRTNKFVFWPNSTLTKLFRSFFGRIGG